MNGHGVVIGKVKGNITAVHIVIRKVFFDGMGFIATADDELIIAVVGIGFHDMPQDWLIANLDHGFGFEVGFFGDSGSEATG